jgi:hypothetical protein
MTLTAAQQKRALRNYLEGEARGLMAAGRAVVREAGKTLKSRTSRELRKNFRSGSGFARGVKLYNLESNNRLGPATYVRLGKIQSQFQENTTMVGRRNLVILLPGGERLGFKRIGKRNSWESLIRTFSGKLVFTRSGRGTVVSIKNENTLVPIYKLQKTVTLKKRLTFLEEAEKIGNQLPSEIERIANGR